MPARMRRPTSARYDSHRNPPLEAADDTTNRYEIDAPMRNEVTEHDRERMAATRTLWEDLALRARALHCPEHVMVPWRVSVSGDTPQTMRLQISGCCPRLQAVVTDMIQSDPRISGPS